MLTLEQLSQKNPSYLANSQRWDFYYRSYMGGQLYRDGQFLLKYWGEDQAPIDVYQRRLDNTPLDNHVKTTVDVYRSFLYKNPPVRVLGSWAENPFVQDFLRDVDLEGQGMDSFLKTALDMALVLGNIWLIVDKPAVELASQAEALALGIRGYVCAYTPQMVLDWNYSRGITGRPELTLLKLLESATEREHQIRIWTPASVERYTIAVSETGEYESITDYQSYPNALGYIPAVNMMPVRSMYRGVGNSVVADVADVQRSIYNKLSELEQNIRLSNHPSLVKTAGTQAGAGAGSIITMPEDLPGDKNPFLLQPTGASIQGIIDSINKDVEAINRMTHLSAVRAHLGAPVSGVALQTERQLLNSMLSDLADTVEETEIAIWRIWSDWQDQPLPDDFSIEYVKTFDMRDEHSDLELYRRALEITTDPELTRVIQQDMAKLLVTDVSDLQLVLDSIQSRIGQP